MALLEREGIERPAADLTPPVGLGCSNAVSAEEEASMFGTDRADRVEWIRKMMSEVEVSSSDHPEDVATAEVTGVPVRFERDRGLMNNAVSAHEATGMRLGQDPVNWPSESPNAVIRLVKLWSVGRIPAANRQVCRLDQGRGHRVVWLFWSSMSFRSRK